MRIKHFVFVCLLVASASRIHGQTASTASLTGTVTDPKGAIVIGARVSARNSATGLVQVRMTNAVGAYTLLSLAPGQYEVACEATGLARAVVPNLRLSVGQNARLDLKLPVGVAKYEVTVTGMAPVQGNQTTNSQVLSRTDIHDLPVLTRNYVQLTLLTPRVLPASPKGARQYLGHRYPDNQFSFEGLHHQYNYQTIDGANATVFLTNTVKSFYSMESVQEFRVTNSEYTSEQGHAMGGVINVITRSGSNALHGELYEFFMNDALNKPDFLSTSGFHVFRRNEFGAAAGGPIRKNRFFAFGTYEGQRQAKSPTFPVAFVQNLPAINVALQNLGMAPETTDVLPTISSNERLLRADYVPSERNRFMVRYNLFRSSNVNDRIGTPGFSGDLVTPVGGRHERLQDQGVSANFYSFIGASWTNDAGFGFARHAYTLAPRPGIAPIELDVLGVFSTGITTVERATTDRRFHVHDKLTWTHGLHELKFGAEYIRSDAAHQPGAASSAIVPGLTALLAPQPNVLVTTLSTGAVPYGYIVHADQPGAFVQDQWRATRHLTFNLGLRYDLELPGGLQAVIDSGRGHLQPRVGFAWSIGNEQPFIIRGGFGIYTADRYHPFMAVDAAFHGPGFPGFNEAFLEANPFARSYRPLPDTIVSRVFQGPSALPALVGFTTAGTIPSTDPIVIAAAESPTLPNPYAERWGLEVERQLGRNTTFVIGYSGLHSLQLPVTLNPNLRPATAELPSGKNDYEAVGPARAADPVLDRWRTSIQTGEPFDMVFPMRGGDGIFRPFLTRVVPMKNLDGQVVRWFGTNTDISEQKKIEEALRDSEQRFRSVLENMSEGLMLFDNKANLIYQNHASQRIHGFDPRKGDEPLEGKLLKATWKGWDDKGRPLPPDEWPISRVVRGERFQSQVLHAQQVETGHEFDASYNGCPLYDSAGNLINGFITVRDITEERGKERALRESEQRYRELSQQLEELEAFSYSVSHDLRAPLRTLQGFSQALLSNSAAMDEKSNHTWL